MPHAREPRSPPQPLPARRAARLAIVASVLPGVLALADPPRARVLDAFDDVAGWRIIESEGVRLRTSLEAGVVGTALRLDYEFTQGAGFCIVERALAMDLPADFEYSYWIRGVGPDNNLEFKLIDDVPAGGSSPAGENVWWRHQRAFRFPEQWTRQRVRARHATFAWGPDPAPRPRKIARLQFAIASAEGGSGSVWLDELGFREVPAPPDPRPAPSLDAGPAGIDGDAATGVVLAGTPATLDLGYEADVGAIDLQFAHAPAPGFRLEASGDRDDWSTLATRDAGGAARQIIATPDLSARRWRLTLEPTAGTHELAEWRLIGPDDAATPNDLFAHLARAHRGKFPAYFRRELRYWTIVGDVDSSQEYLVDEDGAVELSKGGARVEPVVAISDGRVLDWSVGDATQSLAEGYLPIATVSRRLGDLDLGVTAAGDGDACLARYTLRNTGEGVISGELRLLVRPFQVNPPSQFLNTTGGVASVRRLERRGDALVINGTHFVRVFGVDGASGWAWKDVRLDAPAGDEARDHPLADGAGVEDPDRLAEGALVGAFRLEPGELVSWHLAGGPEGSRESSPQSAGDVEWRLTRQGELWRERLAGFGVSLPESAGPINDTLRAQVAYILINRDGPAIQPGSRSYERSWMRDGSLTSAALLSLGFGREAREFIDWYAGSLFPSGRVPCVVDARGPDPVDEHDSHGQYLYAVWNWYAMTGSRDREFLRAHYANVRRVVGAIQALRETRRGGEYLSGEGTRQEPGKPPVPTRAFFGLMPESISHEGYSSKPMHSYWDDLWTRRGLRDAARIAEELGEHEDAARFGESAADMERCLVESVELARRAHGVEFMPGCVELGDFDPTSTTMAVWPCDVLGTALEGTVRRTFDLGWNEFVSRRERGAWEAYTPYELRQVGAWVRLGRPERAAEALAWYFTHQRPAGWRHWAEVVWREERAPKFMGDMPHTWVGSDFINSARAMFVREVGEGSGAGLEFFAGIIPAWGEDPGGVSFRGFRTAMGEVSGSLVVKDGVARVRLGGPAVRPPGGVRVVLPIRGRAAELRGSEGKIEEGGRVLVLSGLPVEVDVVIERGAD